MESSDMESTQWFSWCFGMEEEELIKNGRERLLADGTFINKAGNKCWNIGHFEYPSVAELVNRLPPRDSSQGYKKNKTSVALTVIDGCDIGRLQAELKTEEKAIVQIASNFNCLEVPSRSAYPDYGHLVHGYATDSTQGPASSFGVPAASLFRCHFPFFEPGEPPSSWGQTRERQVELLSDVRRFFGTCVNGKVTLSGGEEPLHVEQVEEVSKHIRVGIHTNAQVVFGRGRSRGSLTLLPDPFQFVDQVISASVNWESPGKHPPKGQLETLTRAALRAAYDGAYLAAILRGRRLLLLTLIGGGVFGNPLPMILEEIAGAHDRWAAHPASALAEVRLCLYPNGEAHRIDAALKALLSKQ